MLAYRSSFGEGWGCGQPVVRHSDLHCCNGKMVTQLEVWKPLNRVSVMPLGTNLDTLTSSIHFGTSSQDSSSAES